MLKNEKSLKKNEYLNLEVIAQWDSKFKGNSFKVKEQRRL